MKILIVNDDGYESLGLRMLIEKAVNYGSVIVYAPLKCESAQSQKITIHQSILVEYIDGINVVHGSTADCVRLGLFDNPDVDLVLSGVNNGLNVGRDIYYSSTIAGVIQAGILGYKSVALSCDKNFDDICLYLDFILDELLKKENDYGDLLNVNFPVRKYKEYLGVKKTVAGKRMFENKFIVRDGRYHEIDNLIEDYTDGTDSGEVNKGFISVSRLSIDRTF